MATDLSSIIVPSLFSEYTALPRPNARRFVTSPVVGNMELTSLDNGGKQVTVRYFVEPESDDEVLTTTSALTTVGIGSESEVAIIRERGKSFGSYDLTALNAGADPLNVLGNYIRDTYWVDSYANDFRSMATGVVTASAFSSIVNDVTGDVAKSLTVANYLDSRSVFGDNYAKFQYLLVHGDVYHKLEAANEISFERPSEGAPFGTWRGQVLLVDDKAAPKIVVDASAGITDYVSMNFTSDAIMVQVQEDFPVGNAGNTFMTELEREGKKGLTELLTRRRYFMHLKGTKWVGSQTKNTPSNAELATGANWQNAHANIKNYGFFAIRHRLT